MFSWLVLLTLMATIAFYLLFPRTDLINLQDKPMDDVDAKRMLVVHQAAVNLATTKCPDRPGNPLLYTLITREATSVTCDEKTYALEATQLAENTVGKFLPETDLADKQHNLFNDTPKIKTKLLCLDSNKADASGTEKTFELCDPVTNPSLAAFIVTYAQMSTTKKGYLSTMPMLPYMLGEAFEFKYTGKSAKINKKDTSLRLNTYCGRVEGYDANKLPPEFKPGHPKKYKQLPFLEESVVKVRGGHALNNTRYQIATLPHALDKDFNAGEWVVCITPLNEFDGSKLTIRLD